MMLSGPSPGTERYKEAKLFISRVLDGASISPRSMESLAINRRAGREQERVKNREGDAEQQRKWQSQHDYVTKHFIIIFHVGYTHNEETEVELIYTSLTDTACYFTLILS